MESESVSSGQGISEQGTKISLLVQIRISSRSPLKKSLSLFFVVEYNTLRKNLCWPYNLGFCGGIFSPEVHQQMFQIRKQNTGS